MQFKWRGKREERQFFRVIRYVRCRRDFEERERDYKLAFAGRLRSARAAALTGQGQWQRLLLGALRSPENNLIHWIPRDRFVRFVRSKPQLALVALRRLWAPGRHIGKRVDAFASCLQGDKISQPAVRLTLASILLMGEGAQDHPPVRLSAFRDAFARAGAPDFAPNASPGSRYTYAMAFLDDLADAANRRGIDIRDRLDAQSIVWWIRDGWSPSSRDLRQGDIAEPVEFAELPDIPRLTKTQRKAIVEARRGQDWFRERLLDTWVSCAVTGCTEPELLRASHLKPWKRSSNAERLDVHNGLLLTPTLDAALDKGLISFRDDGRILVSPLLTRADRRVLGLSTSLRLSRKPTRRHRRFLAYHRQHVFRT